MSVFECPYCENPTRVPDDCREQDVPYEAECSSCHMSFIFYVEYDPSYTCIKAPCLNGGDHDYQPISGFPVEFFKNKRRCSYCANEITVPEETTVQPIIGDI